MNCSGIQQNEGSVILAVVERGVKFKPPDGVCVHVCVSGKPTRFVFQQTSSTSAQTRKNHERTRQKKTRSRLTCTYPVIGFRRTLCECACVLLAFVCVCVRVCSPRARRRLGTN